MVSICLIGNESLQKILRLLTVLAVLMMQKEFVLFITNHYVSKNTDYAEDYAKIIFQEYLRISIDDGAWRIDDTTLLLYLLYQQFKFLFLLRPHHQC
jgi:hypothetical protein